MLNSLREATEKLHRELEKENLANKITDHSISLEEYKLLMLQNHVAYSVVEDQLFKILDIYSPSKTQLIEEDLKSLNLEPVTCGHIRFEIFNKAESMGAAYVILGSAMGGFIIGREMKNCESLKDLPGQQFYSEDREGVKNWNNFTKSLKNASFTEEEVQMAQQKAIETFQIFSIAYKTEVPVY